MEKLRSLLLTNKWVKLLEILLVFLVAGLIIKIFAKPGDDNLIYNQAVVWIANITMLVMIWSGLKIRGESWEAFGLSFKKPATKEVLKIFLRSLLVVVLGLAGYVLGSIVMVNITGMPESADFSNYAFLKDNPGMLILSLAGVYIASSFGEEVVYRAFLINRIAELGLDSKKGIIVAVVISAVIFGLAHYSWGPMGIVQTGFFGLAFGLCYIYMKRRLWSLILAHAYMDTILFVQLYLSM